MASIATSTESDSSSDDFDLRSPQLPPIPPRSPMRTAATKPLILGQASQAPLDGAVINEERGNGFRASQATSARQFEASSRSNCSQVSDAGGSAITLNCKNDADAAQWLGIQDNPFKDEDKPTQSLEDATQRILKIQKEANKSLEIIFDSRDEKLERFRARSQRQCYQQAWRILVSLAMQKLMAYRSLIP
ncbi:hypothetical protein B0J14DRAFT_565665 [Halenospora varia]|nr:hypothetical protein B0J14DRAFT_565665 [Halenospora varia]